MPGAPFTRSRRLLGAADFARVFRRPERSSDRFFTVLACPSEQPHARLGLAVSRKTDRRAVGRNRIRRIARESFRTVGPTTGDFVVVSRQAAAGADNETLRRSLARHWDRLGKRLANNTAHRHDTEDATGRDG